jgi:hypothetical protein
MSSTSSCAPTTTILARVGLECGDPMTVVGERVDRVIDLPDARVEAVMVRTALPAICRWSARNGSRYATVSERDE